MPAFLARLGTSKRREEDTDSRKLLFESLSLLTLTRSGRDFMRQKKVVIEHSAPILHCYCSLLFM